MLTSATGGNGHDCRWDGALNQLTAGRWIPDEKRCTA